MIITDKKIHLYSKQEEKLNVFTHGIASFFSVCMLIAMIIKIQNSLQIIKFAMLFFCISNCLVYISSTSYHLAKDINKKIILQKIDHAMVALIILGTAVPMLLVASKGMFAHIMLIAISVVTIINIVINIINVQKFKKVSLILYVISLLLIVIGVSVAKMSIDKGFWILFLCGLGIIIIGGVFYMQKGKKYTHFIWHIADIVCSILHFFAFYIYLVA